MSSTMSVDARFSVSRVIGTTFEVIGRNFALIVSLAVLVAITKIGIGFLIGLAFDVHAGKLATLADLVGDVPGALLGGIATAAITQIAISSLRGERETAARVLRTSAALVLPIYALILVIMIGAALGVILLVVPGVLLALRWSVAIPARVAEGPTVRSALKRSAELTRGHCWGVLGVSIGFLLLASAIEVPLAILRSHAAPHGLTELLVAMARIVEQMTIVPTVTAACFVELCRIREGVTPSRLAAVFA